MATVISSQSYRSTQEAATALELTDGRIRQLIRAKEILAERLGDRAWAIPSSEVDRVRKLRSNPKQ
jgi:excisionase family DNA binding protein